MKFSIIVPVYQDDALRAAVRALQQLDFPQSDFEVIVVENGKKTDWIEECVRSAGFRYVFTETAGSYHGRNVGIENATGELLAFTDSDCQVDANWLSEIDRTFQSNSVAGVMGFTRGTDTANKIAQYEQRMYEANIAGFTGATHLKRIDTRNFAIRHSTYATVGGFADDLRFGGDMEYGARVHAAGLTLVYNAAVSAQHANIEHLGKLLQKRLKQNYANMRLLTKHDTTFVREYFPQLLRYQPGALAWIYFIGFGLIYLLNQPISHQVCTILPRQLGYFYFKAINVVAIRLGMLKAVLQSHT